MTSLTSVFTVALKANGESIWKMWGIHDESVWRNVECGLEQKFARPIGELEVAGVHVTSKKIILMNVLIMKPEMISESNRKCTK